MKPEYRIMAEPTADQNQDEAIRLFGSAGDMFETKRQRVAVAVTETKRAHGLGRVPVDIVLGPPSLDCRVWRSRDPDLTYYYLQASSPCTVSVWLL